MFQNFEPYVALRYLKSRRKEVFSSIITVISVLGLAISVMVLDMVFAIMTGFTEELQSKFKSKSDLYKVLKLDCKQFY